ncbi:aminopeptidase P N-terminal domain-containing protein [Bdellovibrio sp. HCB2-146]|uniref:aminopeptidase P N-terminal domain-containing protein n=1 Tax=Bdellovibrio sp. HCB2-146 TaxID=3394362 RepID=UPI0039BD8D40
MEAQNYLKRRLDLATRYSNTLFVISSGTESMRSHSVAYRYKTPSDFLYLTGLNLSHSYLIIAGKDHYILSDAFARTSSVWGEEAMIAANEQHLLGDLKCESLQKLDEILHDKISQFDRLAIPMGRDAHLDQKALSLVSFKRRDRRRLSAVPLALSDSRTLVGSLRLHKDTSEIAHMREASLRSSRVHAEIMKSQLIGKSEIQIANLIESLFLSEDMQWTSYESIVGSGERAVMLHARATQKKISDGELILIDAGAEWNSYCADITRTIPAGKKFSAEQRALYDIVLKAQKAILAAVKTGTTIQALHELGLEELREGLLGLGYDKNELALDLSQLMPHSTSHWIGMDVHDPSAYYDDNGQERRLEEGMCFTVEPGLYFREGFKELAEFEYLGVRIEDDVCVTSTGCEVLTSAPKETDEIEALRAKA